MKIIKEKRRMKIKLKKIKKNNAHIYCQQTRTVTCYKTDLSSRQGGRPTTNKTAAVLTTSKIWSWVPEGLNAKTDRKIDGLTVGCEVTLSNIHCCDRGGQGCVQGT